MNNQFMARLEKAKAEKEKRDAVMRANFRKAVVHETELLGCGQKCFWDGVKDDKSPSELFVDCCNDGVIRVDFTRVNTAAVVENVYGDVENLSQEDVQTINQSLKNF